MFQKINEFWNNKPMSKLDSMTWGHYLTMAGDTVKEQVLLQWHSPVSPTSPSLWCPRWSWLPPLCWGRAAGHPSCRPLRTGTWTFPPCRISVCGGCWCRPRWCRSERWLPLRWALWTGPPGSRTLQTCSDRSSSVVWFETWEDRDRSWQC